MAAEIAVKIDDRIVRYLEARAAREHKSRTEALMALLDEWYESTIRQLHQRYLAGDITLRGMARRLGLTYRELYQTLEERGLTF